MRIVGEDGLKRNGWRDRRRRRDEHFHFSRALQTRRGEHMP